MQTPVSKLKSKTMDNEPQLQLLTSLVGTQDEYILKLEDAVKKFDKIVHGLTKTLHEKNKLISDQAFKIDQLKRKLRRRR